MTYTSARNFFVARLNQGASNHNRLVGRRVTVFFQTAPGLPKSIKRGIEDLEYKVFWGAEEKQSGRTSTAKDGKVVVVVSPDPNTQTILEILGTRYEIHRLQNLARANTIRGMQQRLSLLGYYFGALAANETVVDLTANQKGMYNNPNKETEKAILDFQADQDLFADAMYGPKTSKAMEKQLKKIDTFLVAADGSTSDYEARKADIGAHTKLKKLAHKSTRVFPVRFARAPHATDPNVEDGAVDANAPDPDDRGFEKCPRSGHGTAVLPIGFDSTQVTQAETRVRLMRINIADDAGLFVTSSNPQMLEITEPRQATNAGGTTTVENKLPATNNVMIKLRARRAGRCFVEVRYGAQDGPIIHRLRVVINRLRTLQVKAHAPVINGGPPPVGAPVPAQTQFNTRARIVARFADVNKIYFPHGIKFEIMADVDTDAHNFLIRGCLDFRGNEIGTLAANKRAGNGAINVIFLQQIVETTIAVGGGVVFDTGTNQIGGAASSARSNPNSFIVFLADWAGEAQTIAHELGHVLHLVNDQGEIQFVHVNAWDRRQNPNIGGTGVDIRDDIVSRRRLMWAYTDLNATLGTLRQFATKQQVTAKTLPADSYENIMAYRTNVGYTNNKVGVMLAIKNFKNDTTDQEMQEVQKSADQLIAQAAP